MAIEGLRRRSGRGRAASAVIAALLLASGLLVLATLPGDVDAQQTATVQGTIKVARAPAAPAAHRVTTNADVCGQTVPNDSVSTGAGGALAGAVVWLEGAPAPAGGAPRSVDVTLDQRRCRFEPHVQTATVGASLGLTSRDPILHNIHAYLGTRTLFNVAIPVAGMVVRRPLSEAGRVQIKCDVHSWMSSWVVVFSHPYHAVTGRDGSFRIAGVPAGTYPVKVWHATLGDRSGSATVAAGGTATVNISY